MSKDVKGVFVRLPLSDDHVLTLLNAYTGDKETTNPNMEASLISIGTPVTDGELPTEVVRVREHCKDIELPWTHHKVPPSDQDASEYELEVDRLITHKQALAKLAEKDAEIARLRDVLSLFTAYESLMDDGEDVAAMAAYANLQLKVHEAMEGPEAISNLGAAP